MSNDKISNNDVSELLDRGINMEKLHRYSQAIECFSKILEIEPNNTDIISHIYKIFMINRPVFGKPSPSVKELKLMKKIVENNPYNTDAWNALGWAYQNQRKLNIAKECYDNVREIEAKGRLLKKLKELEEDDEIKAKDRLLKKIKELEEDDETNSN